MGNLQKAQRRNQSQPWSPFPLLGAQEATSAKRPPPRDPPSLGRVRRPSPKKSAPTASAEHTGSMNTQPEVQPLEAREDAPQPMDQLLQTQKAETQSSSKRADAAHTKAVHRPGLVFPSATQSAQADNQEFHECCTRLRTCPAITPPSSFYAEAGAHPLAGWPERSALSPIVAPHLRPGESIFWLPRGAVTRQAAPSRSDPCPIALAPKTADPTMASAQEFRLVAVWGKIAAFLVDTGSDVWSLPQRKMGTLAHEWAMVTRMGPSADSSATREPRTPLALRKAPLWEMLSVLSHRGAPLWGTHLRRRHSSTVGRQNPSSCALWVRDPGATRPQRKIRPNMRKRSISPASRPSRMSRRPLRTPSVNEMTSRRPASGLRGGYGPWSGRRLAAAGYMGTSGQVGQEWDRGHAV